MKTLEGGREGLVNQLQYCQLRDRHPQGFSHLERRNALLDLLAEDESKEHLVEVDIDDSRVEERSPNKDTKGFEPRKAESAEISTEDQDQRGKDLPRLSGSLLWTHRSGEQPDTMFDILSL